MQHLFSSTVRVEQMVSTSVEGRLRATWEPVPGLENLKCRLDLNFIRPGKDQPMPVEAGRAPDRIGVLFCMPTSKLKAGQRIVTVAGPETGIFDIRVIPDVAQDFSTGHHIEVQVVESAQDLSARDWSTA